MIETRQGECGKESDINVSPDSNQEPEPITHKTAYRSVQEF